MQATQSGFRASPARRTGLIAAAALAVAALAAGAALLERSAGGRAAPAAPQAAAAVLPVGLVGHPTFAGDPSVPSAASVFERSSASPEEPIVTF